VRGVDATALAVGFQSCVALGRFGCDIGVEGNLLLPLAYAGSLR
jgi:hypothetical protein